MKHSLLLVGSSIVLIGLLFYSQKTPTMLAANLSQDATAVDSAAPEARAAPDAGPDLMVESIQYDPDPPFSVETEVDITPIIKNIGDAAAPGIRLYLYIDPSIDPPTSAITPTTEFVFGIPLEAGASFDGWTRTDQTFTNPDPQICVWVDPLNRIAEDNEENNLLCRKTVQPPQTPDAYDNADDVDDDDICANSTVITADGAPQNHNLARTNNKADEDWAKFDAVSGVEYTIEAKPLGDNGADADLYVNVLPSCDSGSFGSGAKVTFKATEDKTYYILVGHNNAEYGPRTDYALTVNGQSECRASFEPNNICAMPVDFPLSDGEQIHSFCEANDVDWIRFEVEAGGQYKVSTESIGADADPRLSIFPSCDASNLPGQILEFTAPAAGYYYIKAENNDPNKAGVGTDYQVNVEVVADGCEEDIYEQDDDTASAQPLTIDSNAQTHNICPKGEQDWVKIEATKETTFTVETLSLEKDADTYLCIYDRSGNKLNCDRDNGSGLGSRVTMSNVDDTLYYARITDEDSDVAGKTTAYKLRAYSANNQLADEHEPDNTQAEAKPLSTDGSAQEHNIHKADDTDWIKFSIPSTGSYIIKTQQIGPEGDTELDLYDSNGNRLAGNDDFTADASSQIGYNFTSAGDYFVRVRLYNPTRFGSGTEYSVTVERGEPPNTPPPTQTPPGPPPATPEPPAGEIETLILVNQTRLAELYPDAPESNNISALMAKLGQLASHPKVKGEVILLNRNQEVSNAYDAWTASDASYKSVESANQVADAIRRLIMSYLSSHGGVKYVVLVGDDRAFPARRVIDATPQQSEKTYNRVNDKHPAGAAILADYYMTDDFFVDREPIPHKGREVYVPDLTTGRLIEKPSDMINIIDIFLAKPVTDIPNVFVSGYDFVKDSASNDCTNWRRALGDDTRVTCVIGENWNKDDLLDNQTSTDPAYVIQSINGHADHDAEGVPGNRKVNATEINDSVFTIPGGLVYTLACHGGLNIPPENETLTVDLPESFVRKGMNYAGNYGFGWGYRGAMGLSEQMMQLFTARLIQGGPMGEALASTKREYYRITQARTGYDEKVMQQFVFYGLPMFETIGSGALSGDPFDNLVDDTFNDSPGSLGTDVLTKSVAFDFGRAFADEGTPLPLTDDTENDQTFGSYPTLAGYSYAEPEQPVQALYFKDMTVSSNEIRSVVVRSATINENVTTDFDPVIATPDNEFVEPDESQIAPLGTVADEEIQSAWYPANIVDVQSLNGESTLATSLGQFNPATNEQRTIENLDVDVYYSLSSDVEKPEFTLVDALVTPDCNTEQIPREVTVKVGVQDESGIEEVTLQYVVNGQESTAALSSLNLTYDASAQKWIGKYVGDCDSRFQISAMDKAFNRALDNNKGERYAPVPARLDSLTTASNEIYLPVIQK